MRKTMLRVFAVALCLGILSLGTLAFGWPFFPGPPIKSCPNKGLQCLDVWDPVTCDNGVTYSNQCYADRACATGCVEGYPTQ